MGLSLRNNQVFRPKRQDALDRRIRRRHKFIEETILRIEPEAFAAEESIDLFTGRPIDARRAARRAGRRASLHCSDCQFLPRPIQVDGDLSRAHRPVRKLSRLNRSVVFPPLVPTELKIEPVALNEILAKLRSGHHDSQPHHLLDALATASGISWESCAQIVFNQKLVSAPIDLDDVKAARDARSFWNQYGQGRARYLVLIMEKQVPAFQGDWAYFEDTQLESLLPGIIIPTRLKREHYLTNYVVESSYSSLDVYAGSNLAPLFQHRFLPEFNPLVFGKPKLA
jgi:hypothetical protein